ncbi:MAG: DUF4851 domain-containing protein [Desulfovibrionaceae bacterium]|nr:DUF4851 domain-containing protein [Desulfovibrionaceae bacterium]
MYLKDANLAQPHNYDAYVEEINGIRFYAQTFLSLAGRNAFISDSDAQAAAGSGIDDRYIIRHYSARFNNDNSKIIIEYREKLPEDIKSLDALPFGRANLLKDFAARAHNTFTIRIPQEVSAQLGTKPLPLLRLRYLDEHFFGSASPAHNWDFK